MIASAADILVATDSLQEAISRLTVSRQRKPHEIRMRRLMERMFNAQRRRVVERFLPHIQDARLFKEAVPPSLLTLLSRIMHTPEDTWESSMEEILAQALAKGLGTQAADLGITATFTIPTDRIERLIATRAGDRIAKIDNTTREIVRQILETGIREHKSYSTVAAELRKRFTEFSTPSPLRHIRDRAELIAVTEIGQAYTDGQLEVGQSLRDAGITMEKAWLTVGDDRVDPDCAANEDQGWIPWTEHFSSGSNAPLDHPGCRCCLQMRRAA